MHEAFLPICLLRDYPYRLICLTCYDNFLLVGTKQGLLLVYELTPKLLTHLDHFIPPIHPRLVPKKCVRINFEGNEPISTSTPDPNAPAASPPPPPPSFSTKVHTTRTFGSGPILQLEALPDVDLLLALAGGQMNVYQLQNYQLVTTVPLSKGANLFAHCTLSVKDKKSNKSSSPVVSRDRQLSSPFDHVSNLAGLNSATALRVCVAVKRQLLLWRWDPLVQKFLSPGGTEDPCTPELAEKIRSIAHPGRNQLPLISFLSGCFASPVPDPQVHDIISHDSLAQQQTVDFATNTGRSCLNYSTRSFSSAFSESQVSLQHSAPTEGYTRLGLGRDDVLTVWSPDCEGTGNLTHIRWTGAPNRLHVLPPYLVGAMEQFLEVRVADPCELVQQLPIARVQALCHSNGWFYVVTAPSDLSTSQPITHSSSPRSPDLKPAPANSSGNGNEVWLILSANRTALVQRLVKRKEFDLAILLAKEAPWMGQNAIESRQISVLYAYHLYQQQEFSRALQLFTQQVIDPSHVLGLFPDLMTGFPNPSVRYPLGHVPLSCDQFMDAAEPLITYLLTWRRLVRQALCSDRSRCFSITSQSMRDIGSTPAHKQSSDVVIRCYPIFDGISTVTSGLTLLQIIDTCLLKCYLATNTARVGPLLRQVNSCQLEESERTLLEHHRYQRAHHLHIIFIELTNFIRTRVQCSLFALQDLVMLYQAHGLHRKALSLLEQIGMLRLKSMGSDHNLPNAHTPIRRINHQDGCLLNIDPSKVDAVELNQLGHPRHMIHYLQNLGPAYFDLVTDHAGWIMHNYPVSWMRIFMAWERQSFLERRMTLTASSDAGRDKKAHSLAYRGQVIKYLEKEAVHLIIPFLEHLIFMRFDIDVDSEDEDEGDMENGMSNGEIDNAITNRSTAGSIVMNGWDEVSASHLRSARSDPEVHENLPSEIRLTRFDPILDSLWPLPGSRRKHDSDYVDADFLPPIIRHPEDGDPVELHTRYAAALMARVRAIQPTDKPFTCRVYDESPEWGPVARLRRRLFRFLNHPNATYSSRKLLDKCPFDALFEERTVLLANLNHHEHAITFWVHVLHDWNRAISHCALVFQRSGGHFSGIHPPGLVAASTALNELADRHSNFSSSSIPTAVSVAGLTALSRSPARDSLGLGLDLITPVGVSGGGTPGLPTEGYSAICADSESLQSVERDIYFLLLQICVQPPSPASLGVIVPGKEPSSSFTPKLDRALEVLRRFGDCVDPTKAVRILVNVKLSDVADFLKTTLFHQESMRAHLVFLSNAAKSELSASRLGLVRATRQQFLVSAGTLCRTCRRRIGTSAFARHPSTGELEHYGCCRGLTGKP
ncbi:Vam6/Vps39-like protein vacuolar protein sorting-associated protein 39 [Paragonimus westermani]|uniref:Vam6/Vps39-like protein vacuolar protein sorting-associated protein 39 n=1 Tax=Paragonimus westermani TaxID=34504 RepID=A0A5J4NPV2_9TREM|nr:Vam6/Vps39-like protein vacuolar protein sorting-associated protein 39 [Paragonimus westermani]